jgi:hypothetical protein
MAELQHFYHAILTGMSGIVVPIAGRIVFLPASSDCLHDVSSAQVIVTGEVSVSMQQFMLAELARRQGLAGGAA